MNLATVKRQDTSVLHLPYSETRTHYLPIPSSWQLPQVVFGDVVKESEYGNIGVVTGIEYILETQQWTPIVTSFNRDDDRGFEFIEQGSLEVLISTVPRTQLKSFKHGTVDGENTKYGIDDRVWWHDGTFHGQGVITGWSYRYNGDKSWSWQYEVQLEEVSSSNGNCDFDESCDSEWICESWIYKVEEDVKVI